MAWDVTGQSWTAAELVADVRRVASLPVTSTDFTDLVLLREATDVLWGFVGWAMQQAGDGRLVELLARPVSALLSSDYRLAGECELPPLAIADTVESVSWLSSDGRAETNLRRIDHAQQSLYDAPGREGSPEAYALLGSRLRLFPKPNSGGTLRLLYQRRHPMLVPDTVAYAGTAILTGPRGVSTTETIFSWNSSDTVLALTAGDRVDLLNSAVPYAPLVTNTDVTFVTGTTSFSVTYPSTWLAGRNPVSIRVVRSGTSPYVHFPLELRACVTEKTAANVMRRVGDLQNAQASEQAAMGELARFVQMASPRSKRDHVRAVNPNSLLRRAGRRGWLPR